MGHSPLNKMSRKSLITKYLPLCARRILYAAAVFIILFGTWYLFAPYFADDPMLSLEKHTPAQVWLDRNGRPVRYRRTCDYEWRFPVPLNQMGCAVKTILTAEDKDFYHHHGVDYGAVLRAFKQNICSFRIISGASTISMQLAAMSFPPGRHTLFRKIRQAVLARKLEMCHSKDEILTEYMNRICFGGKIYGIEAAALYYFGIHAADLNEAEAALLCGLPQCPNVFRPDRNPQAAKNRQHVVLKLMVAQGTLTQDSADEIEFTQKLRYRDFRQPPDYILLAQPDELNHFLDQAAKQLPGAHESKNGVIETTLDSALQTKVLEILRQNVQSHQQVKDAAAVLLDNQSGDVLVYVGTLDFHSPLAGQVNVINAIRSAGSTLKPFLYAEAIEGGLMTEDTVVTDSPVQFGNYMPGNFDGTWEGQVTVRYALSNSLNTPAVRLASRLGLSRMEEMRKRFHWPRPVLNLNAPDYAGLSFALGTAGNTLAALTGSYRVFPNGGTYSPMRFLKHTPPAPSEKILSGGTCEMIGRILRERPLGASNLPVAWKSGTSSNLHDAWCFAFTPEYTLGVWFGNKNGKSADALVGAVSAVPAAAEIMDMIYRDKLPPDWQLASEQLTEISLCRKTGLRASPDCTDTFRSVCVRDIPLTQCRQCSGSAPLRLEILSPRSVDYLSEDGAPLSLELSARVAAGDAASVQPVQWFADGVFLENTPDSVMFPVGFHEVQAIVVSGGETSAATVSFTVQSLHDTGK